MTSVASWSSIPLSWMFCLVVMSMTPTSTGYLPTESAKNRICSESRSPFGTLSRIINLPGVFFLRWKSPAHFKRTSASSMSSSSQVVFPSRIAAANSCTSWNASEPHFWIFNFSCLFPCLARSMTSSDRYSVPRFSQSTPNRISESFAVLVASVAAFKALTFMLFSPLASLSALRARIEESRRSSLPAAAADRWGSLATIPGREKSWRI
mmetsp:Transcript_25521/g.61484  ORF Transcript_25521/g.61484 Transcript_25521/m.61484 type:complete len:209 (+) Transcript_25521:1440-2066(+)